MEMHQGHQDITREYLGIVVVFLGVEFPFPFPFQFQFQFGENGLVQHDKGVSRR